MYQRPFNSNPDGIARHGRVPKNTTVAAPVPGMKRQSTGAAHPYLHGRTLDDSAPLKDRHVGKDAAVHPNMKLSQAVDHFSTPNSSEVFADAANFGRKPQKA